jgi:uncharacterized 2Fe-2S/4Fe-4S cluster protein (DUF4445 family)
VHVTVTLNGRTIESSPGQSLFECAERAGLHVPTSCRKEGRCKECIVEISDGMALLSAPTDQERHLKGRYRLSCQSRVAAAAGHVQGHTMRRGQMRIERRAPAVDASRLIGVPDPAVTRDGDRVLIDGNEVDRVRSGLHGVAMDLGTTTVVLRLLNLETGETLADTSFENPQRFGGSDVMARIQYASEHGRHALVRTLAAYVRHAIEEFPVDPTTIYEMTVVGNSTMRDLFFRKDVSSIGQSPYRSTTETDVLEGRRATTSLTDTGRRCLMPIHPKARVYGLPVISGHVGADAAACLLATNLAHEDRLVAIMDIGTNTELIVGNRHRILAASCPAGPAFEGGSIACGMPALDGAVESVLANDDGTFRLGVIGDGAPEGLCGSGLVDLLSELIRTGRMNQMGRFQNEARRITLDRTGDLYLLESDVNELAQAKGANAAGLRVVFEAMGVDARDIDIFYLAGAFGRRLQVESAQRIGLLPTLPSSRVVQLGNAAIEGASIALLSRSKRRELEALVGRVEHCRLEAHPHFFDHFVEGCQFKPLVHTGRVAG